MQIRKIIFISAISLCGLYAMLLTSCATASNVDSQGSYTSATPRNSSNLIVPPGLDSPQINTDHLMVTNSYQLESIPNMHIEQGGSERWLVMNNKTVNQVWPVMLAFLNQQGVTLRIQNQAIGLIQSDWISRSNIVPETGVRALFDWAGFGGGYSLQSRYLYRIHLWQNESNTLIFVTNYQMNEVYPGCVSNTAKGASIRTHTSDAQATKWMPVPASPELEFGFLTQFMGFAGFSSTQIQQITQQINESVSQMAFVQNNTLIINTSIDLAWWRTAVAVERANLGISSRNKDLMEYYVYPLQEDIAQTNKTGFMGDLFNKKPVALANLPQAKYIIKLQQNGQQTILSMSLYPNTSDPDFNRQRQIYLEALYQQLR